MPNSGKKNQEKRYVTVDFNGRKVQVLDLSGPEKPKQRVKLNKHWSNRTGQHLEWGPEPGDFEITREWIFEYRTKRGSWTAAQLQAIGLGFPPREGWIDRSVGILISDRARYNFELRQTAKDIRLDRVGT